MQLAKVIEPELEPGPLDSRVTTPHGFFLGRGMC